MQRNKSASNEVASKAVSEDEKPMYFPLITILLVIVLVITKREFALDVLGAASFYVGLSPTQTFLAFAFGLILIAVIVNGVFYLLRSRAKAKEAKKLQDANLAMERKALIDIFNAANGKKWRDKTYWCSDEPIHRWKGVFVDRKGGTMRVEKLILPDNNLTGTLSPAVGTLEYLTEVDFRQNNLEGEIPPGLAQCYMLEGVYLSDNRFTGKIPRNFFKLPYILGFYSYNNCFDEDEKKSARIDLEKAGSKIMIHPANV
jgi:hypothetical protein